MLVTQHHASNHQHHASTFIHCNNKRDERNISLSNSVKCAYDTTWQCSSIKTFTLIIVLKSETETKRQPHARHISFMAS